MPRPYHKDLRRRVVSWVVDDGLSPAEAALRGSVSTKTVRRYVNIFHTFHAYFPPYLRPRGRPLQLTTEDLEYMAAAYISNPAMLLDEIQDRFYHGLDKFVTIATIERALNRLGQTRKIMRKVAAERDEVLRTTYEHHMALEYGHNTELFVCIDKTAVDIDVARKRYGRSLMNTRATKIEVFNHQGRRYSILPALSSDGVLAWRMYEGGVTKAEFVRFLREELVSHPLPPRVSRLAHTSRLFRALLSDLIRSLTALSSWTTARSTTTPKFDTSSKTSFVRTPPSCQPNAC
jgi:transposase